MKNFLIFLSVFVVFGLAINDLFERLDELDKISDKQKIENNIQTEKITNETNNANSKP